METHQTALIMFGRGIQVTGIPARCFDRNSILPVNILHPQFPKVIWDMFRVPDLTWSVLLKKWASWRTETESSRVAKLEIPGRRWWQCGSAGRTRQISAEVRRRRYAGDFHWTESASVTQRELDVQSSGTQSTATAICCRLQAKCCYDNVGALSDVYRFTVKDLWLTCQCIVQEDWIGILLVAPCNLHRPKSVFISFSIM